jgi:hypothetical protein
MAHQTQNKFAAAKDREKLNGQYSTNIRHHAYRPGQMADLPLIVVRNAWPWLRRRRWSRSPLNQLTPAAKSQPRKRVSSSPEYVQTLLRPAGPGLVVNSAVRSLNAHRLKINDIRIAEATP